MASRRNVDTLDRDKDKHGVKESASGQAPTSKAQDKGVEKLRKPAPTKTVSVIFYVTAPEGTGKRQAVFLAGALNQFNSKLPDWDPQGVPLKRTSDGRYTVTIKVTPGSDLYYKYTLGSWEQVELDENCRETPNRFARLHDLDSGEVVIHDTVYNWHGAGR